MATLRRIHDDALGHLAPLVGDNVGLTLACAGLAESHNSALKRIDEARAEVNRLRADLAAATAKTDDGTRTDEPRVVDADGREIRIGDVVQHVRRPVRFVVSGMGANESYGGGAWVSNASGIMVYAVSAVRVIDGHDA
jgi:hypothetical protein